MLFSWLCHSIWLLFIYNMLKIPVFFIPFRWWAPWLGDFIGYSFGISRNNVSTVFYGTAFLEISKEAPLGYLWSRQGENWRKRLYFHHTVEMKQPHIWQNLAFPFLNALCWNRILLPFLSLKPRAGMNSFHSLFKALLRTDFFPSSLFQHLSLERFFP